MVSFYLLNPNGQVVEIRRKVKINNLVKYIIDKKNGVRYVSSFEFNQMPIGHKLVQIK
jgi:hypothetical protein